MNMISWDFQAKETEKSPRRENLREFFKITGIPICMYRRSHEEMQWDTRKSI